MVPPPGNIVPFPRTFQWSRSIDEGRRRAFESFHRNVASHVNEAAASARTLLRTFYNPQWRPDFVTRTARLVSWDVEDMVHRGNSAIRSADSALDMGLQLINHVLDLGVAKRHVRWTRKPEPGSLHAAILELPGEKTAPLLAALKRVFNSMGYEGLDRYRDWLTHRGAPYVERTRDLNQPVALPVDAFAIEDSASRDLRVWGHLWSIATSAVHVTCATFVPPVQAHSRVFSVVWGGLMEDVESYRRRNLLPVEAGRVVDAGEQLGRYPLTVYVPAVQEVVSFVAEALTNRLDLPLAELLSS